MSAARTAVTKHTRSLSQPLRRSFYTPFAALQHSPLHAKSNRKNTQPTTTATATHEHEHEREHAARTLYVVSEPNAADFKYGVPAGAYPNAAPYHPHSKAHAQLENVSDHSSTSSACVYPVLTRAVVRDVAGLVGARGSATAADASGGSGRPGLASDDGEETMATTMGKEDRDALRLASRNPPPPI
jgi:DNA-binding transcriptional MocR family regulator